MAQRSLQIMLKKLSVEELKSYGIITQHDGKKSIAANENRKRKRTCIDDIGNSIDFVGRITRSKSQKKAENTSINTVNSESSAKPQSSVDSSINRKRKRTEKPQRSNIANDFIDTRIKRRGKLVEKNSISKRNHKTDTVDNVEKPKANGNASSKRKEKQVGVKDTEQSVPNRNDNRNDKIKHDKVLSDSTRRQTRSATQNTSVHVIDSKNKSTVDLSAKQKQNRTDETQTRTSETENRKQKRKFTKMQLQEYIDNDSPNRQYIVNEIIIATIPGFAPWPARILKINGQTITVEFFGTGHMYVLTLIFCTRHLVSIIFLLFQKSSSGKLNI